MFPIIKIRLIHIKRNIIKNLISLSYPIIITYLYILFLENIEKIDVKQEIINSNLKRELRSFSEKIKNENISEKPTKYKSKRFNIFNKNLIEHISDDNLGIICENEDLLEKFSYFASEYICINNNKESDYEILEEYTNSFNNIKKRLSSHSNKCKIKRFRNKNEFNKYINSFEYKNDTEFFMVVELKKDDKHGISFNILNKKLDIISVDNSKNLLMFNNPEDKTSIFNLVKDPTKNENTYKNLFCITANFLKMYSGGEKINIDEKINIYYKPLNTPPIYNKFSSDFYIAFIPMIISISFSATLFSFVLWMVKEKFQNLHELLFRYGISQNKYYQSWFIIFMILTIIPIIICSLLFYIKIFVNISFVYIFFSLILFDISLFSTSLLMHTLTKTTDQSQTLLKLIYLFLTFLSVIIIKPEVDYTIKKIFSFFPQIILVQNFQELIILDNFKTDHFYIDFQLLKTPYNKISLLDTFITYFIVIFLHIFIAKIIISYQNFYANDKNTNYNCRNYKFILFLKNILKNCFKFSFTYNNLIELENNSINQLPNEIKLAEEKIDVNDGIKIYHETLNSHQMDFLKENNCLSINNIIKSFDDVVAVNNFKGSLFPSEIFCLLGHNGAGKTTLIKTISGEEQPDNGDILLFGNSILKNKKLLYRNIGVCNQDNNFFDYLTVYEHLKYFSEIKQNVYFLNNNGLSEIKNLIQKLGLEEKKNSLSKTLSGGQKRKLCVALALAGNSKLILLDEPTSGMDILAKRELWNFLKNYKNDKIIILTTHSLEEAEYLGDRIGIMLDGKYVCSGTGSYLKNKYPCGYNINFLMNNDKINKSEILDELKEIDNSATIKVASKNLLSINFLYMEQNIINSIFEIIEKNEFKEKYGIVNYTISTTSLEDVFLKLNNDEISNLMLNNTFIQKNNELKDISSINNLNNSNIYNQINVAISESNNNLNNNNNNLNNRNRSCGIKYYFIELFGGIKRNYIPIWRNKCTFVVEVLSASITIIIYILGFDTLFDIEKNKSIELMKLYDGLPIYYSSNFEESDKKEFFNIFDKDNIILQKYPFLKIKEIDFPKTIKEEEIDINYISDYFYNISKYKNERNFLVAKKSKEKNTIDIYVLYQSASRDYLAASLNYILSIIFEKKYDIKTTFLSEINKVPLGSKPDDFKTHSESVILFYSIFMLWNSFISLSGYMLNTPLKERIKNIKHLLKLSGASMFIYWLSLLITDIIKYLIFIITVYPFLIRLDKVYLYNVIISFPFILALNMFVYSFSFITDSEIHIQKFFILTVYILSIGLPLITLIKNKGNIIDALFNDDKFIITLSDIFPFSSFLLAMFRLFYNSSIRKIGFLFGNRQLQYIIFNHCTIFLIQFIFYLFVLFLFEIRFFERIYICISNLIYFRRTYSSEINYDANNNQLNNNINNGMSESNNNINVNYHRLETDLRLQRNSDNLTTKIKNLYKTYFVCKGKNVRAVNNLNLNLEKNENFGLIGFNGSGKTTTFKSITKEIFFDKGQIELFGYNISKSKDFEKLTKIIGYCPQENALFDYLTVEEVLKYFKKLKRKQLFDDRNGIDDIDLNKIYDIFGLRKYKNKLTTNLSGGNKRKLNFAIALMNNPKIILLDEPSTGVDPESRRLMWINLLSLKREYNMILSTHSMEEAEILSDRVGWMKEGNFAVEGVPEELKLKYSSGYYLFIKFISLKELKQNNNEENIDLNDIKNYFANIIKDENDMKILFGENNGENNINEENNIFIMNGIKDVFKKIEGKYKDAKIIERQIDNNSFKFLFHIEQNNQGDMFKIILNIKSSMPEVSEININIESLENILTYF